MRRRTGRRNTLVMMARQPVAGAVKTRLARDIGSVPAVWWYRHNLRQVIRRLGGDPRWEFRVAICPDTAGARPRFLEGAAHLPQGAGGLGERLERALARMPPGPVLVIGSDIPDVDRRQVARAFRALGPAAVVLGPSGDGGYWAIGHRASVRRLPRGSLAGIRWSTSNAMRDTMRALAAHGEVALADVLHDVDCGGDLERWKRAD